MDLDKAQTALLELVENFFRRRNEMSLDLDKIQTALLELVEDGKACATTRIGENGRRIFVAIEHATEEDREFTQAWVKDPHFGVQ